MPENLHEMNSKELLKQVKKIIPPLLEKFHKGQQGRVAVIGGCEDYTGAPFFSANASALLGADLSHVICEPQAAQVIKTYSPNLMVHPYMRQSNHADSDHNSGDIIKRVSEMLDRLHAIVIGPGLGRDKLMQESARGILEEAKKRGMGVVLDADGLFMIQNNPDIVHGYTKAVLTPNVMEFARLCNTQGIDPKAGDPAGVCQKLAESFGGVTVIQKGPKDYISNGKQTIVCDVPGGLKRSGGQGDTLTGTLVTMLAWTKAYKEMLWEHDNSLSDSELIALSAYGAAAITRTCSRLAFEKKGRALQALDLSTEVPTAFEMLFEDKAAQKL
ncbi:Ribokinase-like protein [Pyronema domesticum]|uniref:ATP-dependent (S)-NAD(P)H-hydrate dehydratase n=1 Tax=Pyronema omphalodes (strain CBS 100304) TaxID=1076935 RepID=U4L314_PYROM|nr:Ribokinase-like protein [Pyronema domesticum]KAI5782110.1 Ribokinase-like protein [Pyronema domesticum]CCX04430.1 Similar to ATP-dependent (S)-NAD(P)H-hydrate dehydratase; acc. no. Q0UVK8 [Pyronema omphalodes CBS 100304]